MLLPFISDANDKHPTFIFSVIRSRMLPPFISDAKDKHPTFIFSVIRSRILPPFISDFFFFGGAANPPNKVSEGTMKRAPYVCVCVRPCVNEKCYFSISWPILILFVLSDRAWCGLQNFYTEF